MVSSRGNFAEVGDISDLGKETKKQNQRSIGTDLGRPAVTHVQTIMLKHKAVTQRLDQFAF